MSCHTWAGAVQGEGAVWGGWRAELGTLGQSPVRQRRMQAGTGGSGQVGAVQRQVHVPVIQDQALVHNPGFYPFVSGFCSPFCFFKGLEPMTLCGAVKAKPLEL